jgi:hypothetical protein
MPALFEIAEIVPRKRCCSAAGEVAVGPKVQNLLLAKAGDFSWEMPARDFEKRALDELKRAQCGRPAILGGAAASGFCSHEAIEVGLEGSRRGVFRYFMRDCNICGSRLA